MNQNRFRPAPWPELSQDQKDQMAAIKAKAAELEALYDKTTRGRYQALAMTDLESSVMWAVKEITS